MIDENTKRAVISIIVIWLVTVILVSIAWNIHKSEQIHKSVGEEAVCTILEEELS